MDNKKVVTNIIAYTDGSCAKKKTSILCGYGVYFPNKEIKNISKSLKNKPLTNNRAELYAIYKCIKTIYKLYIPKNIEIYTDSQYCIGCLTEWIEKWKMNGWKTSNNKPVSNRDILEKIYKYMKKKTIVDKLKFIYVAAHTGKNDEHSVGNDMADRLAKSGAKK